MITPSLPFPADVSQTGTASVATSASAFTAAASTRPFLSGGAFYEFFAGGGMARAGLGDGWRCLLANDNDEKKGAAYCDNWGTGHFKPGDVGLLSTADLPKGADLA